METCRKDLLLDSLEAKQQQGGKYEYDLLCTGVYNGTDLEALQHTHAACIVSFPQRQIPEAWVLTPLSGLANSSHNTAQHINNHSENVHIMLGFFVSFDTYS